MNTNTMDYLFDEIALLPDLERDRLFYRMKNEFYSYPDEKIVAYSASGQPLSERQYQKRIREGILQCREGKCTSLEQLSTELGYDYENL